MDGDAELHHLVSSKRAPVSRSAVDTSMASAPTILEAHTPGTAHKPPVGLSQVVKLAYFKPAQPHINLSCFISNFMSQLFF